MYLLTPAFALLLASLVGAYAPLGDVKSTKPVDVIRTKGLPKVELSLSYIANLQENPDGTTTVICKHGEPECAGNKQELCFKKHHPDRHKWFTFVNALNTINPPRIGDINYAREVARTIGAANHFDKVAECAQSDEGHQLHVASVRHTLKAKVSTSCTVFIDHQKRCVVDGGAWRECPEGSRVEDFVKSIREAAKHQLTKARKLFYQFWN
ncbi:hypothetical protein DFQ26_005580 [Actinomortierella ambigua]|nr:hypothetical protein DFQ26_005580 [Actinomortierella ambigua]